MPSLKHKKVNNIINHIDYFLVKSPGLILLIVCSIYAHSFPSRLSTSAVVTINDLFYFSNFPMLTTSVSAGRIKLIFSSTVMHVCYGSSRTENALSPAAVSAKVVISPP